MEGHERSRDRRYRIQKSLYEVTFFLEFALAIIVIGLVLLEVYALIILFKDHITDPNITISYSYFLERALDIVIGVEFLKMLCRHNMDSVIEVLMFAMARHMIVENTTMIEGLICIVAVSILFVVRKYLFVAKIDKAPSLFTTPSPNKGEPARHGQKNEAGTPTGENPIEVVGTAVPSSGDDDDAGPLPA